MFDTISYDQKCLYSFQFFFLLTFKKIFLDGIFSDLSIFFIYMYQPDNFQKSIPTVVTSKINNAAQNLIMRAYLQYKFVGEAVHSIQHNCIVHKWIRNFSSGKDSKRFTS